MEIKEISVFKKSTCKSIARQILNYLHMIDQLQLWPRQRLVLNTKGSDCWVCCHFWQPLGHWISPSRKRSLRKMILHKSALDFRTNTMYCKMKISLGGYDFVWIRSFQSSGDFYAQAKRNKNFDAIVFFFSFRPLKNCEEHVYSVIQTCARNLQPFRSTMTNYPRKAVNNLHDLIHFTYQNWLSNASNSREKCYRWLFCPMWTIKLHVHFKCQEQPIQWVWWRTAKSNSLKLSS